jgi:hypothetical protein
MSKSSMVRGLVALAAGANLALPALLQAGATTAPLACKENGTECERSSDCGPSASTCVCFPNPVLGPSCFDVDPQ